MDVTKYLDRAKYCDVTSYSWISYGDTLTKEGGRWVAYNPIHGREGWNKNDDDYNGCYCVENGVLHYKQDGYHVIFYE